MELKCFMPVDVQEHFQPEIGCSFFTLQWYWEVIFASYCRGTLFRPKNEQMKQQHRFKKNWKTGKNVLSEESGKSCTYKHSSCITWDCVQNTNEQPYASMH